MSKISFNPLIFWFVNYWIYMCLFLRCFQSEDLVRVLWEVREEGHRAKSESFNRMMWAAWRANKAWHDRSVYLFCREPQHYFPTTVLLSSYLFRKVHTSQQRRRSVARGVTLYNRGWLPFDKPLYGAFNTSLIEIGFRGSYVKRCEMYLIFPSLWYFKSHYVIRKI